MSTNSHPTPVLSVKDAVVTFDGFRAIDNLSIDIAEGELRFLIGPNGAGKTTFMDLVTGKIRPDSGTLIFKGNEDLTRVSEDRIVRDGIGRKFQTPKVFSSLTVYDNVEVAAGFQDGLWRLFSGSGRHRNRVMAAIERVGLTARTSVPAANLSHGERQWLEIAMLLVEDPDLLLLDEPVAGMTGNERERTGELLHQLEGEHSLVVTEHDMDFVRQFSRTVTVLHQGRVLREGTVAEIQADPEVQEVYIGRSKVTGEVA